MSELLTIEQTAAILSLHTRTIRNYIKDKRIHAVKAGGQWRIERSELDEFIGIKSGDHRYRSPGNAAGTEETTASEARESFVGYERGETVREQKIRISTVVDIIVKDADEAARISNSIFAVMNSESRNRSGLRCDYIHYPETRKARFIFWGPAGFITDMLKTIEHLADN